MRFRSHHLLLLLCFLSFIVNGYSQSSKQYNSLLWEITGNGLAEPSYLYGTMHISQKLAFHLDDSFYNALRSSEIIALELDPSTWQVEDYKINKELVELRTYYSGYKTDYLNEHTFKEINPIEALQSELMSEPSNVNSFLYRSEYGREEYQEDTYLDLFLFQSGKKLGKEIFPLEEYLNSQLMVLKGYEIEMEERRNNNNAVNYSESNDISQQMIQAYRNGDLSALDSLYKLSISSEGCFDYVIAFRNIIHANGMDSLMRSGKRVFTGVGAAHLAGEKGVIELIRAKGYKVRPVATHQRNSDDQKAIQEMIAPVQMVYQYNEDSLISFSAPGILLPEQYVDSKDRIYFSDMSNGAYFLVSRVRTMGITEDIPIERKMKIVDSIAYEYIKGDITSKRKIENSIYPGVEIQNTLKSGKKEKYHIYATPNEWMMFKISGNGTYANSWIADSFFNSIQFNKKDEQELFRPERGGFEMLLPHRPVQSIKRKGTDGLPEWRYVSRVPSQNTTYIISHKNIYAFDFIDQDSVAGAMLQYSIEKSDQIVKRNYQKMIELSGRKVTETQFILKNGQFLTTRFFYSGPQYYLVAVRGSDPYVHKDEYFQSFKLTQFNYPPARSIEDSLLNLKVNTPIAITDDSSIKDLYFIYSKMEGSSISEPDTLAGVEVRSSNFIDYHTGEVITMNKVRYGNMFTIDDSLSWVKSYGLEDTSMKTLYRDTIVLPDQSIKYTMLFEDSASHRIIKKSSIVGGRENMLIQSSYDKILGESEFLSTFFNTVGFLRPPDVKNSYKDNLDELIAHLKSTDTNLVNAAKSSLISYPIGNRPIEKIEKLLDLMKDTTFDVYSKREILDNIHSIEDSTNSKQNVIADRLKEMYQNAEDEVYLQSTILRSLGYLNTEKAVEIFKDLILEDPIVFSDAEELFEIFYGFQIDSFKYPHLLFPDLLVLTNTEDYKLPVYQLLSHFLDKKALSKDVYKDHLSEIIFETNIAYKRARAKTKDNDDYDRSQSSDYIESNPSTLLEMIEQNNYSDYYLYHNLDVGLNLLSKYYGEDEHIAKLFDKIFLSDRFDLKLIAADQLLSSDKLLPDSILNNMTNDTNYNLVSYRYFRNSENSKMAKKYNWKSTSNYATTLIKKSLPKKYDAKLITNISGSKTEDDILLYEIENGKKNGKYYVGINISKDSLGYYNFDRSKSIIFKKNANKTMTQEQIVEEMKVRSFIQSHRSGRNYFTNKEYDYYGY